MDRLLEAKKTAEEAYAVAMRTADFQFTLQLLVQELAKDIVRSRHVRIYVEGVPNVPDEEWDRKMAAAEEEYAKLLTARVNARVDALNKARQLAAAEAAGIRQRQGVRKLEAVPTAPAETKGPSAEGSAPKRDGQEGSDNGVG